MISLPERRENVLVLAGTLGLALFGLMLLVGLDIPGAVFWLFVAAASVFAFARPEVGFYALLFNALIGLTHMASLPRIGPLSMPIAFEAVLLLAVVHRAAFKGQKLFVASPQHLLLAGIAFWMAVSIMVNGPAAPENLAAMKNLYLAKMIFFFLMTNILLTREALKRLVVVLMACNAGLLAISFLVRSGYFGSQRANLVVDFVRTSGLVQNPNNLAFDLTTMLIFAAAAFLYVRGAALKLALAALALGDVVGILTTLSRSGFVSLCCVLLFIVFKLRRDMRIFAALAVVTVVGLFALPERLETRFSEVEQIQDVNRLSYAKVGFNMALHNPVFGVGLGNYVKNFDKYNTTKLEEPVPAHNMYMDLSAQMGLPALAMYVLVFAILLKRFLALQAYLAASGVRDAFFHHFGWALQAFIVNLAVFGLSGDVEFEYSVFAILGFGMLLVREHTRRFGFVPLAVKMRPSR